MAEPVESAAGNIYDLGYRRYQGARLGRYHAVLNVYWQSLRGVFGFGRHNPSKIIPIGLAVIALIPAVIQLGFVALSKETIEVFKFQDYLEFIQWPLALFVAAVGPELLGRDQKHRTLSLYFARSLLRSDYVLAKMAALTTALFAIAILPETVVFIGNSLANDADSAQYLRDNWTEIAPIVGSCLMVALLWSGIALAIASQTSRWQLASGGVIAFFAIPWVLGSILVNSVKGGIGGYGLVFSGFHIARGVTLWLFGVTPRLGADGQSNDLTGDLALADAPLFVYAIAAVAIVAITLAITYRRYRRLSL